MIKLLRIIGLIITVCIALAVAIFTYINRARIRRYLRKRFKGKRIAVLGESSVGKTTFINFLTKGEIPLDKKATLNAETLSQEPTIKLEELNFKLDDITDFPGNKDAYLYWKTNHNNADMVYYLLMADKLMDNNLETINRVKGDIQHICDWRKELTASGKEVPAIFILGTHCDLDPVFSNSNPEEYEQEFRQHPIIKEIHHRTGAEKIFTGSMKDNDLTRQLVSKIFR